MVCVTQGIGPFHLHYQICGPGAVLGILDYPRDVHVLGSDSPPCPLSGISHVRLLYLHGYPARALPILLTFSKKQLSVWSIFSAVFLFAFHYSLPDSCCPFSSSCLGLVQSLATKMEAPPSTPSPSQTHVHTPNFPPSPALWGRAF